jgi:serine/threonine protein kinase
MDLAFISQSIPKKLLIGSEMIGKGSFGKIYKASFAGFAVAVKEVQAANISCVFTLIQQTAHLFYELSSIRQCQHPNIVELIGAVVDFPSMDESNSPTFGLVLELCSCGSLHDVLFETCHRFLVSSWTPPPPENDMRFRYRDLYE